MHSSFSEIPAFVFDRKNHSVPTFVAHEIYNIMSQHPDVDQLTYKQLRKQVIDTIDTEVMPKNMETSM